MSASAVAHPVSETDWLAALAHLDQPMEIVSGEFVAKRVGGNPHHYIARRLAGAFEAQWAGTVATSPGNWILQGTAEDISLARMPDVLVDGDSLLTESSFMGVPDAAVEVWSPGNTLAEMNAKRRDYRQAGLPVFCEAWLTDTGDVHLDWYTTSTGDAWALTTWAAGEQPLLVAGPRSFTVVPNDLLRPAR